MRRLALHQLTRLVHLGGGQLVAFASANIEVLKMPTPRWYGHPLSDLGIGVASGFDAVAPMCATPLELGKPSAVAQGQGVRYEPFPHNLDAVSATDPA